MLSRFAAWVGLPKVQLRLWGFWTLTWIVLMPVVMLSALNHSVPWLNWESLFANAASCGTAWVAALAYTRARSVDDANLHAKLDHVIEHHPDIPPMPDAVPA
jgi:hypothetical protein